MRTSKLILTIGGLLICSIFLLGSQKEQPMPPINVKEIKVIGGIWHNRDYNVIENKYAKIKFSDNNIWVTYNTTSSEEPLKKGTYTLIDGWRGDGSIYYKVVRTTDDGIKKYELYRFSRSSTSYIDYYGRVLEIVSSTEDFPTEINTDDSTYSILYRRQGGQIVRTIVGTAFFIGEVILILIILF